MATNVHISQKDGENNMSVLRRFRNRVKTFGAIKVTRDRRYYSRNVSDFTQKKSKLRMLDRQEKIERLYKEGKLGE